MTLNWYRCQGGKRTLDVHHRGRVVFSFHYWPWLLGKRWKIEVWRGASGGRYLEIGPLEFIVTGR